MSDYIVPNPKNEKSPYSCPKCGSDIQLRTSFSGFDVEDVNPKTGDWEEDTDTYTERTDIYAVEWRCTKCKWVAAAEEADEEAEEDSDD